MANDAQNQANRKTPPRAPARRPRTARPKVRLNALKHGGRAKTTDVMPVLPHDVPMQLQERIQVGSTTGNRGMPSRASWLAVGCCCRGCSADIGT